VCVKGKYFGNIFPFFAQFLSFCGVFRDFLSEISKNRLSETSGQPGEAEEGILGKIFILGFCVCLCVFVYMHSSSWTLLE